MARYMRTLPLGWKIVLGVLGAGVIFTAVVAVVALCNGQSFVEGFETLFGIAEKAVENAPAVEDAVEEVASNIGIM